MGAALQILLACYSFGQYINQYQGSADFLQVILLLLPLLGVVFFFIAAICGSKGENLGAAFGIIWCDLCDSAFADGGGVSLRPGSNHFFADFMSECAAMAGGVFCLPLAGFSSGPAKACFCGGRHGRWCRLFAAGGILPYVKSCLVVDLHLWYLESDLDL